MHNSNSLSTVVTRPDRAVNDESWIRAFLEQAPLGVLATAAAGDDHESPQPFISTLSFAFDAERHAIYLHTGRKGRVWDNIHANPRVCFSASQMGRLLPAKQALNFGVEFASVVIFGRICLVEDPAELQEGLQMLLDKYFPHLKPSRDYRPITDEERDMTALYRIDISEWSAKQKQAPADYPGAFDWPPPEP